MRLLFGLIFAIIFIIACLIGHLKNEYELWQLRMSVRKNAEEIRKRKNAEKLNKIIEDNKDEEEQHGRNSRL